MSIKADLRAAQLEASKNAIMTLNVARALIEAKIARTIQVLEWLKDRYDISKDVALAKREAMNLRRARTVGAVRSVEGRVALKYWDAFGKALPEHLDFQGRMTSSHQNNATDPVNAALNYGYGFLEGECRRAINAVGLEPSVGFLHDFSNYQTKQSLVYDLEEPFRWLVDLSVIQVFESKTLDLHDFYFTGDDYRYRFEHEAKVRFIETLRDRFNSGMKYKGRILKWDTVIEEKLNELARYMNGRTPVLDFAEPAPILDDNRSVREAILRLTQAEAKRRGIGKSTLHYLRKRVRTNQEFKVYSKVQSRLA
jgi:CRISPR-associated protein Cas1